MTRPPTAMPGEAGFSLVELLVSISIMALVGGAVVSIAVSSFRTEQVVVDARAAMDDAREATQRLSRDIRQARRVLVGSDARQIVLWIDDDRDALTDAGETITYRLVDGTAAGSPCTPTGGAGSARMTRRIDAGAVTTIGCEFRLADAFTYTGTPVARVGISLTARARTDDEGVSTVQLQDSVRIRNVP